MNDVSFSSGSEGVDRDDLAGFFVGWPLPPSLDERLGILHAADDVVVCRSTDGTVVGFATAITDGRFAAYIPLGEVLPGYQRQGIGSQLVELLLVRLRPCCIFDLVCDDDVVPSTSAWVEPGSPPSLGETVTGSAEAGAHRAAGEGIFPAERTSFPVLDHGEQR